MTEQHRLWLGRRSRKCSNMNHSKFPWLRTRQGKELSHTLWHSLLLLHKALTQLSRSKIKLIWKLCRWEMYHVWHLLQPFWEQGGWSRRHHSPLPQTQFLHLASRPQWSSFYLSPSVSTSVNVFKISGAKQRSSLKKTRGASSGYRKALFRRCTQSLGGHEALRQTVALKSQVEVQIHLWNRSVEVGLQDLPTYLIHQQDCFGVLMMDISDSLKNRAKNPSVQLTLSTSYNPQFSPQECS